MQNTVQGMLISDWEALDRLYSPHGSNYRESILRSINAGIDMVDEAQRPFIFISLLFSQPSIFLTDMNYFQVMVPFRYELFLEEMLSLVESGEIPISRVDDAVERILRVKFVAGLFEFPLTDTSLLDVVGCKVQRLSLPI